MHSRWSDGEWAPRKLVKAGRHAGLGALALTDHDDVRGFPELVAAGMEHGVEILSGVEISTWQDGVDVHILGYGFDPDDPALNELLGASRVTRRERAERMVVRLGELGVPVELDAVLEIAGPAAVGRPHVARALLEAGHVGTVREAFDRWLGDGKPACVDKLRISPAEAVRKLHDAGGVAVCAHPVTLGGAGTQSLDRLVDAGIDGVEVRHGLHGGSAEVTFDRYAREHGLVRTGGSDFHGPRLGSNEPGSVSIPRDWWDALLERVDRQRSASGKASRVVGRG
jgi:predicted metal-dependent phosphoesterase TrpH